MEIKKWKYYISETDTIVLSLEDKENTIGGDLFFKGIYIRSFLDSSVGFETNFKSSGLKLLESDLILSDSFCVLNPGEENNKDWSEYIEFLNSSNKQRFSGKEIAYYGINKRGCFDYKLSSDEFFKIIPLKEMIEYIYSEKNKEIEKLKQNEEELIYSKKDLIRVEDCYLRKCDQDIKYVGQIISRIENEKSYLRK